MVQAAIPPPAGLARAARLRHPPHEQIFRQPFCLPSIVGERMIVDHPDARPALLPALAAMTWLQAMVALALFAPGAVAPTAGLSVQSLSVFSTAVFAVGILTAFWAGDPINRIGSLRVASLCAAAVVTSMAFATLGSGPALLLAGLCLGFAFGPETPASTALLGKLVTDERRALVFSV